MAFQWKNCFRCVKYSFYGLNLLFWMIGTALLGLGVWLHVTTDLLLAIAPGYRFLTPAALCIAAGCLSIIIGFIGCCGAITENRCMVITYCVLVMLIFSLELAAIIAMFLFDYQLSGHVEQELYLSIRERYPITVTNDHERSIVDGWDLIHKEMHCCGVRAPNDWFDSHGWPSLSRVPDSCCVVEKEGCGLDAASAQIYAQGCMGGIDAVLRSHLYAVGVVTAVFTALQLLSVGGGMMFLCLWNHRKSRHQR